MSLIENIREEFLHEARSAPKLFQDLAKVEQYIAESYKTRALIELIQNADDATATSFGIHEIEGGFIVGNNGREFTANDIEALCRSGASNKQRGNNTIGYRGIGFKSVVNLSNKIAVFSGDFSFCFDRDKTKQALQTNINVPLIRVPHPIDENDVFVKAKALELISRYNYNTAFAFQNVVENLSLQELSGFDRSSLLFLNNLKNLLLKFKSVNRNIKLTQGKQDERTILKIEEGENIDTWEVEISQPNKTDRVALKKMQDTIVPALQHESVIHSFTPTSEFSGAYIKINGDFSTDPSRKTIDMDEASKQSFNIAVSIITKSIISITKGDLTRKGFFSPFVNIHSLGVNSFKILLFKSLEENLKKAEIIKSSGKVQKFSSIRIKPDWINYEDYEKICHDDITAVSKDLITIYPEIFLFLNSINIATLNLEEVIAHINSANISIIGSAQIFEKIIRQYRYDLDNAKIEKLMRLNLFPVNNSFVQALLVKKADNIASEFREYLSKHCEPADVAMFFKKLNIEQENTKSTNPIDNIQTEQFQVQEEIAKSNFKSKPAIKKWRSAEQNAQEYLNSLNTVLSVKDVSLANIGYDIEVMLTTGKRIYVEIKSVSSFAEPFRITNNEYSSAHSYGINYCIALVINNEPFQIKFIPNPLKLLSFEKRCEKWTWVCEQYIDSLQEVTQIF